MSRSFAEDNAFGLASEDTNRVALETLVGTPLIKDKNIYASFDFHNEGKTIYVELKTRLIPHDRYDTALISASKVEFCRDPTKTYYFVWAYSDGLFYLKYDKEVWAQFECKPFVRHQRSDYNDTPKDHFFIPYTALTRV